MLPRELKRLIVHVFGHLHADAIGKIANRFRIREPFHVHHELDDRAPRMTAEAVKQLLVRRNGKGGRLLAVKRTAGPKLSPLGLQIHI